MSDSMVTPGTVAHQAPLSMACPWQEYWSGLPFISPGDLPDLGIKPASPALQPDSLALNHQGSPIRILNEIQGDLRTSLVVQWIGICLPAQGTRVWSPVQEDPTRCGAAQPTHHHRARAPEPTCALWHWSPCAHGVLEAVLPKTRSQRGKPCPLPRRELGRSGEEPVQPAVNE